MIATHCLFPFILQFLKCITAKHFGTMEHLVTVASRIEAVWIGKFTFRPAERKDMNRACMWTNSWIRSRQPQCSLICNA